MFFVVFLAYESVAIRLRSVADRMNIDEVPDTPLPLPTVIICGMSGSGTRGVKAAIEALGVSMCAHTNGSGDNLYFLKVRPFIPKLLAAAGGAVSQKAGYMSSPAWEKAVETQREVVHETKKCVLDQASLTADPVPADFKWGWKNPHELFVLPVLDTVFNNSQKMLVVARDLRDLCIGHDTQELDQYGHIINVDPNIKIKNARHRCLLLYATMMKSILEEYADKENVLIVRIEDLVIHDLSASQTSHDVLNRVMKHINHQPRPDDVAEVLGELHKHAHSYMGQHYTTEMERKHLEDEVATYTGIIHETLQALGYHTERFELTVPTHPRVVAPV